MHLCFNCPRLCGDIFQNSVQKFPELLTLHKDSHQVTLQDNRGDHLKKAGRPMWTNRVTLQTSLKILTHTWTNKVKLLTEDASESDNRTM